MSNLLLSQEEIPEWLTINFLRDILQDSEVEIKSILHACNKGENFASKIYRVNLIKTGGLLYSVIVKSRPFDGNSAFSEEFLKKFNVFPKEIQSYQLIEKFESILESVNLSTRLAPRYDSDFTFEECFIMKI